MKGIKYNECDKIFNISNIFWPFFKVWFPVSGSTLGIILLALHTPASIGDCTAKESLDFWIVAPGSGNGLMTVPSGKHRSREPKHPCSMSSMFINIWGRFYLFCRENYVENSRTCHSKIVCSCLSLLWKLPFCSYEKIVHYPKCRYNLFSRENWVENPRTGHSQIVCSCSSLLWKLPFLSYEKNVHYHWFRFCLFWRQN